MQSYRTIIGILKMRDDGLSYRACRSRYNVSAETVLTIIRKKEALGYDLKQIETMEPQKVEELFYPSDKKRRKDVRLPDYDLIYERLHRKGSKANLFFLWMEYKEADPDGYQYTQFCHYYNEYLKKNHKKADTRMAVERIPGERVYIDWAGDQPELIKDIQNNTMKKIHLFVTTVGISNMVYAEIFENERSESFIKGTVHALEYYGAVPKYLVPDNCKTAVTKHSKDELIINAAYEDLENFYDLIILPPPARKPRGKATAEKYVQYLETWLLEELKKTPYYTSIESINSVTRTIIESINDTPEKGSKYTRRRLFEMYDKPSMKKLSTESYNIVEYKAYQSIPDNYHLLYDEHYYSVLYTYCGKPAILKASFNQIKICDENNRLIATHQRVYGAFPKYITDDTHMPPEHSFYKEIETRDGTYYRNWAKAIGKNMYKLIDTVLLSFKHEQQAYNSCNGILHLCDGLSKIYCEEAARRCVELNVCRYSYFKKTLKQTIDSNYSEKENLPEHDNIRGKDYYK